MKNPFIAIATVAICASSGPSAQNSNEAPADPVATSAVMQDNVIAPATEALPLPLPDTTAILFDTVTIEHPRGDTFDLYVPAGFQVAIAAHGMNRIRFMDRSYLIIQHSLNT